MKLGILKISVSVVMLVMAQAGYGVSFGELLKKSREQGWASMPPQQRIEAFHNFKAEVEGRSVAQPFPAPQPAAAPVQVAPVVQSAPVQPASVAVSRPAPMQSQAAPAPAPAPQPTPVSQSVVQSVMQQLAPSPVVAPAPVVVPVPQPVSAPQSAPAPQTIRVPQLEPQPMSTLAVVSQSSGDLEANAEAAEQQNEQSELSDTDSEVSEASLPDLVSMPDLEYQVDAGMPVMSQPMSAQDSEHLVVGVLDPDTVPVAGSVSTISEPTSDISFSSENIVLSEEVDKLPEDVLGDASSVGDGEQDVSSEQASDWDISSSSNLSYSTGGVSVQSVISTPTRVDKFNKKQKEFIGFGKVLVDGNSLGLSVSDGCVYMRRKDADVLISDAKMSFSSRDVESEYSDENIGKTYRHQGAISALGLTSDQNAQINETIRMGDKGDFGIREYTESREGIAPNERGIWEQLADFGQQRIVVYDCVEAEGGAESIAGFFVYGKMYEGKGTKRVYHKEGHYKQLVAVE